MAEYRAIGLLLAALVLLSVLPVSVAPGASGIVGSGEQGSLSCTVRIAAVSSSGGGVLGNLTVTISWPGSGRVFISTSPAAEVDTQGSAVIASLAASILAGVDPLSLDFYYEIQAPSIIVGGPSAGAAMALAAYQLLTRGYCDPSVVATGMIQPDTSIGPVGGLKEKLEAVASGGGRVFIIPAGQEVYTYTVRKVQRWGPFIRITQEPVSVNLTEYGQKLGVKVVEASSLLDAYDTGVLGEPFRGNQSIEVRVPEWVVSELKEFVYTVNSTVNKYISETRESTDILARLAELSKEYMNRSTSEALNGSIYAAAIDAITAAVYAELAYALYYALNNNLDVTSFVVEANNTINKAWQALTAVESRLDSISLEERMKAYGKLGIALYYYRKGLDSLVKTQDGVYKLPYSLLGGLRIEGLERVIHARWLAEWAHFWANLTVDSPRGTPLDRGRLTELSGLMLATARTSTAYLSRILKESGATARYQDLPVYLVEEAITLGDPVAQLGLSLEAIAQTTRIIHETFTLKPVDTAESLLGVALTLYSGLENATIIPALLLSSIDAIEDPKTRLHILSLTILEAWIVREVTIQYSKGSNTIAGTVTRIPISVTHSTPRESSAGQNSTATQQTTEAKIMHGTEELLYYLGVSMASLVTGLAIGYIVFSRRRRGV